MFTDSIFQNVKVPLQFIYIDNPTRGKWVFGNDYLPLKFHQNLSVKPGLLSQNIYTA